jgi:hypothetical protein
VAGALHFFAVVGAVLHLIVAERPGHAHIGFIAEHIGGPRQFGLDRRHHQLGGAGPRPITARRPRGGRLRTSTGVRRAQSPRWHGDRGLRQCLAPRGEVAAPRKAQRHTQLVRLHASAMRVAASRGRPAIAAQPRLCNAARTRSAANCALTATATLRG